MGIVEYWEIHTFGGPRFVVAGRDRARPSRLLIIFAPIIPTFLVLSFVHSSPTDHWTPRLNNSSVGSLKAFVE
jgi:hypothetical protein